MKNYKKILSFTLALIMALSALSLTALATESTTYGTEVLKETFDVGSPTDGTAINGYNGWEDVLWGSGANPNSNNTIKTDTSNKVGSILRTAITGTTGINAKGIQKNLSIDKDTKFIEISFKLRRMQANASRFIMILGAPNSAGSISKNITYYYMDGGLVRDNRDVGASATYNAIGSWNDAQIILDYNQGDIIYYLNGTKVHTANLTDVSIYGLPTYVNFSSWYSAGYYNSAQKDMTQDAEFQVDDILVTAYTQADIVAMAGQEVDAALAKLSDVTAITTAENLTLPTAADLGTTATVTWTSNNTSALANDGTVTQTATAQNAKLTATISSGSVTKTKVFDVTVLPASVYFYEGFNSVLKYENMPILGYNSWGVNADATATNDNEITIKKEAGTNNFYGSIIHKGEKANPQYYGITKSVSTTAGTGKIFSFRLMRGDSTTQRLHVYLNAGNKAVVTMYVNTAWSSIQMATHSNKMLYYPESKRTEGNWMDFDVVIDETNKNFKIYVDGELATTDVEGNTPMTALSVEGVISEIRFIPDRLNATTNVASSAAAAGVTADFRIDDIMISEASTDMLSCIAARDALSFGNPVVNDLDITDEVNGTTITLDSSKPEVIANDGKVTRPDTEELTPVTLEVTIAKGSESITKTYSVEVAPKYLTKITNTYVDENSKLDTVYITNFAKLEKAIAFAAVYTKNSDGAYVLKGVQKADDITYITAKGSQRIGFAENKLTVGKGDVIKVFLWNDSESLTPIAKSFSNEYSAEAAE